MDEIKIAVALLFDEKDRILLVRKRGEDHFQLPGGKLDAGEAALDAARREVKEEVELDLGQKDLTYLGEASGRAMTPYEAMVHAEVFAGRANGNAAPASEIEQLLWHDLNEPDGANFAHLLKENTLQMARDFLVDKGSRGLEN